MTDHQYIAHLWLSRMWDKDIEINQLEVRRDKIISSLSGIGNYDSDRIPSSGNDNGTETKNIEYSLLSGQIEKKVSDISKENVRTIDTIDNVKSEPPRDPVCLVHKQAALERSRQTLQHRKNSSLPIEKSRA